MIVDAGPLIGWLDANDPYHEPVGSFFERCSELQLADASLIWLAESLGLLDVLTLDRHDFGIYRTARGQALRNVLFDPPPPTPARPRTGNR